MPPAFPFSAIVGQELLKRALLLGVIQPSLGGVLVRGTKGAGKSTAVRALAALLPPIDTLAGCPFQRSPGQEITDWPLPPETPPVSRPLPLVELPLGATEDRLLGTLHLERALRGERAFEPGLLAAANRGILYIDEVNLLPDHLVDILLDAAASGTHRVEREGLSLSHPARFLLIGTMNPEEGDLRPQLLDRFGLVAEAADLTDPAARGEAVRRRLAYEVKPDAFINSWKGADRAEAERIIQAQRLLPEVQLSDVLLASINERCLAAGVEGLRADLTLCKAACAWAAYQGRREVAAADIDAVAELALAHRRRTQPPEPPDSRPNHQLTNRERPRPDSSALGRERGQASAAGGERAQASTTEREQVDQPSGLFLARAQPELSRATEPGRWRAGRTPRLRRGGVRAAREAGAALAWAATVRAAAILQRQRGRSDGAGPLILQAGDLRFWPQRGPSGCLLFFVVDASGSMAAWRRMRLTKAAILALLVQAYAQRDQVALLTFRGSGSALQLPPTRGLSRARRALEMLPAGGTTPLANGLGAACRFIRVQRRRRPKQPIWTVIFTDGRANVGTGFGPAANRRELHRGLHPAAAAAGRGPGDPWQEALTECRTLAGLGSECLVVDTETGWPRFGRALVLAQVLEARCVPLESVVA
jgi:magnesium chelatase subunit D